jgi:hypothetical protein
MSVIGRLDDQVDALIISPLKKRGAQQTKEEATPQQEATETTAQANGVASVKSRAAKGRRHSEQESSASGELPVWLL